jgi:TrmH family RNA methyltransferase
VKHLRQAFLRPGRDGLVVIEGEHLLQEALRSGMALKDVFVREDAVARHRILLNQLGRDTPAHTLAVEVFNSAAATEAPQGIAAFVQIPQTPQTGIMAVKKALVLVLDCVQDPGNVGTILRSAEAFAATAVIALPGTASFWNLKAVRASAGSVFRVPLFNMSEQEAADTLRQHSLQLLATVVEGGSAPGDVDWNRATALLIGSEGRGLSPEWLSRATHRVTVPMPGKVESLNAAVATSLLLYEASKHRQP